ncbi:MAG: hypothetical protein ACPL3E_01385 [Minisyncoccia bacterium]
MWILIMPLAFVNLAYGDEPIFKSYQDIIKFFDGLANIIAGLFWTAAIIAAIWSGFLFLTSGGNEEKATKAKKMLWYTIIAIIIGLMAFGLPSLIKNILTTIRGE